MSAWRWAVILFWAVGALLAWAVAVWLLRHPGEDGYDAADRLAAAGEWWVTAWFFGSLTLICLATATGTTQLLRANRR